ncbi:MAG: pitrilysin family protein [Cyclobacteriaceae bacterium]
MKNLIRPVFLLAFTIGMMSATTLVEEGATKEFMAGGIKVIYKPSIKEIISVRLFIKGGTANYIKPQEGIESLALTVATEGGTTSLSMSDFGTALEKIGTTVGSSSDYDYSEINLSCIKTFWDESWKLYADGIVNPRFEKQSFELIKGKLHASAKEQESDPDVHVGIRSMEVAYPEKNYAKIPDGTAASLEKLTLEDVKKHYAKVVGKGNVFLVVVGNVTEADLKNKIGSTLGKLASVKSAPKETRGIIQPGVTIENRDIATNYITGSMSVPSINEKDAPAFRLATSIMNDRFFLELRTKRSLTYAPAVFYSGNLVNSPKTVFYASSTDPKQTLQVMMEEINVVKNQGFKEKELLNKKAKFLTGHYSRLETNDAQTISLGISELAGNWKDAENFMTAVDQVTIQDLNAAFKKYSNNINWMYLGKESAVSKEDFKQPQVLPGGDKIAPKK